LTVVVVATVVVVVVAVVVVAAVVVVGAAVVVEVVVAGAVVVVTGAIVSGAAVAGAVVAEVGACEVSDESSPPQATNNMAVTTTVVRAFRRRLQEVESIPRTYRIQNVTYMGNGRTAATAQSRGARSIASRVSRCALRNLARRASWVPTSMPRARNRRVSATSIRISPSS
jgi:hypothetical protein